MPEGASEVQVTVNIAATGQHFLFLPVLFAVHKKFFGYVPSSYNVKMYFSQSVTSDLDVFEYMLNYASGSNELRFGLADPMFCYHQATVLRPAGTGPAIVAGVLQNSGFWAVDTATSTFFHLQDLADVFDRILCYGPDTTSHRIATGIRNLSTGRTIELEPIAPNVELGEYKARILMRNADGMRTLVLSPDILGIEALIRSDSRVRIELPLAAVTEYAGNLVSAFMAPQRTMATGEHTALIEGLVAGIQAALLMVRAKHPDVMIFAKEYFSDGPYVDSAVENALDHNIFAASVEISRAIWDRTTENSIGYFDKDPLSRADVYKRSSAAYDSIVAPHRRFWRDAMSKVSQPIFRTLMSEPKGARNALDPVYIYLLLTFVTLGAISFSLRVASTRDTLIGLALEALVALALGLLLERLFASERKSHCGMLSLVTFILLVVCYTLFGGNSVESGSIYFGIAIGILAIVVAVSEQARRWLWPQ